MANARPKTVEAILTAMGFEPVSGGQGLFVWNASEGLEQTQNTSASSQKNRWLVDKWVVRVSGSGWTTVSLSAGLKRDDVVRFLDENARGLFGPGTTVELAEGAKRDFWVMVEFIKHRSKTMVPLSIASFAQTFHSPHGLGGFHLGLAAEKGDLLVQLYDQFGVGYVPPRFLFQIHEELCCLLGGNWQEARRSSHIFEMRIPIVQVLTSMVEKMVGPQDTARLFQACRDVDSRFKDKTTLQVQTTTKGWDLVIDEVPRPETYFHSPVLEILEARELQGSFPVLDQLLLNGQWEEAGVACQEGLSEYSDSLFLLRRLALLSLGGRSMMTPEQLANALDAEEGNKLFLSVTIKQALINPGKNGEVLLAGISRLGEQLYNDVREPESLKTLEVVLPELLGDAWFAKDPKMAEACYQRVIDKRGNLPRVLTKMALLARSTGARDRELVALKQLVSVERRRPELANIFLRLAELHQGLNPEEVVHYAVQSLRYIPENLDAVNLVCHTLIQSGKPTEAIQVLTDALERLEEDTESRKKAELEIAIGEIWETYLGRRDLARERYSRALALAEKDVLLKRLVDIFKHLNERRLELQALEKLVAYQLKYNASEASEAAERLIGLYARDAQHHDRLIILLNELSEQSILHREYLTHLMPIAVAGLDWQQVYDLFKGTIGQLKEDDAQVELQVLLGAVSEERLKDSVQATSHYLVAFNLGDLDAEKFQFVCRELRKAGQHAELMEVLRLKLKRASEDEKLSIVQTMAEYADLLDSDEADVFAVQLVKADRSDGTLLEKRLVYYQSQRQMDKLVALAESLQVSLGKREDLDRWLQQILTALSYLKQPKRFEAIQKVLDIVRAVQGDGPALWEKAVTLLAAASDKKYVQPYVASLIEHKKVPNLPRARITEILKDDPLHLALYLEILVDQETAPERIHQLAKEAWQRFKTLEGLEGKKQKILEKMSSNGAVSRGDFEVFYGLCAKQRDWDKFLKAAWQQENFKPAHDDLVYILQTIAAVEWDERRNFEGALEAYKKLTEYAEDPAKAAYEMAQFAVEHCLPDAAKPYLIGFLKHDDAVKHPGLVLPAMQWLVRIAHDSKSLQLVAVPLVEFMVSKDRGPAALRCADFVLEHGGVSPLLAAVALENALNQNDDSKALALWVQTLEQCEDREGLQEFLQFSLGLFVREGKKAVFNEIVQSAFSDELGMPLKGNTRHELKVFYARLLVDEQRDQSQALQLFNELFQASPADERLWWPYYSLLKEAKDQVGLLAFLSYMMPLVREEKVDEGAFPMDIAALEQEWQDLVSPPPPEKTRINTSPQGEGEVSSGEPLEDEDSEIQEEQDAKVVEFSVLRRQAAEEKSDEAEENLPKVAGDGGFSSVGYREDTRRSRIAGTEEDVAEAESSDTSEAFAASAEEVAPAEPRTESSLQYERAHVDWRQEVLSQSEAPQIVRFLSDQAFENEVEKHLALQACALVTGDMEGLADWQFPVWRAFAALPYSLDYKSRLVRHGSDPLLSSELARLLLMLNPALVYQFKSDFSLPMLAKRLKTTSEKIIKYRRPLPWTDAAFEEAGLDLYKQELEHNRLKAFALNGLGSTIFFDAHERALYIDVKYYQKRPPTHLRHRVLWIYRAVRLNYYFSLSLDPNQIGQFLGACTASLSRKGLDVLKVSIGITRDPIHQALARVDRERLKPMFEKIDQFTKRDLLATLDAMNTQIYRMNMAESLDLIGIAEAVLDRDLINQPVPDLKSKVRKSALLTALLSTAARLVFE